MPKPPAHPNRPNIPEVKAAPAPKYSKDDNWTVKLRARRYVGSEHCDVWLLKNQKGVTSCLLYGQMFIKTAELLGEKLGLVVDWEERPYEFVASGLSLVLTNSG